jgi:hypothetical protein
MYCRRWVCDIEQIAQFSPGSVKLAELAVGDDGFVKTVAFVQTRPYDGYQDTWDV